MGPNSDTGKGTLYINGEPLAEVGEIKIPLEVEPSDLPPILANVSFTITMDCPPVVAAEVGVVDFQSPVERPNTPDFPLLKINFQENDPTKILQGLGLEQIWDRCKGLICSGENYCKCWRLGKVEQIEQMLYYLNLKSKKKYKKVTLKENGKKMCSICSNLGLRIKCLICPSYL